MKRSQKELAALKSAYKICEMVKENSGNVISGATQDEDTERDITWFNMAEEFIMFYENMLSRNSSTQKH